MQYHRETLRKEKEGYLARVCASENVNSTR